MNLKKYLFYFCSFFILLCVRNSVSKEVYWETSLGPLIGYTKTSLSGFEFYAFEGIPYAKPPVGELRFKAPVPIGAWSRILNASQLSPHCIQDTKQYFPSDPESEDCLYLNIYLRNLSKGSEDDVLVGIYGGTFQMGTTRLVGPDILMNHENLIYINFNYRTNIFGHLSFYDPSLQVPGNAGPKDAVLVLQWIQQYIHEFGGNPAKVTIVGCSSGGILANLLSLHPVASKLFRHAIIQSAAVLTDVYSDNKLHEILAQLTNYTGSVRNERDFLNHLRRIPANDLIIMYKKYRMNTVKKQLKNSITVVIESKINNPNPFLTESPYELILQGKSARIPYLFSFVQYEGSSFINAIQKSTQRGNITDVSVCIPYYLMQYLSNNEFLKLNNDIRIFYSRNEFHSDDRLKLFNICGDGIFLFPNILNWITTAAASNYQTPVYMYKFNIRSDINYASKFYNLPEPFCIHCDELSYLFFTDGLFGFHIKDYKNKPLVKWGIDVYTKIILNFIRTGNPNSFDPNEELSQFHWKPIQANDLNYFIVQPNLTVAKKPFHDRMVFWQYLFKKYFLNKHIPFKTYPISDFFN